MFDVYDCLTAAEAKKEYFLGTDDLQSVRFHTDPNHGFGCGRPVKWYTIETIQAAALRKHGEAGLAKKRAARAKRDENKRKKEEAAAAAEQALAKRQKTATTTTTAATEVANDENAAPNNNNQASAPPPTVVSPKALDSIRKDIRKAFKPVVTWDYLRGKRAPHGCNATTQVPRVQQAEFAALIGRSNDPTLTTLVKRGAWYSIDVAFDVVMDGDQGIYGKGGRHSCNTELGIDPAANLTVKFKPSDSTLSITGHVQHIETFQGM